MGFYFDVIVFSGVSIGFSYCVVNCVVCGSCFIWVLNF